MGLFTKRIYFYTHSYLRDRQLDTIRFWDQQYVVNPELAQKKPGHVSESSAKNKKVSISWKTRLPLLNIKLRPKNLDKDTCVYVWGGLILSGEFIVDLDNPFSLTAYNIWAFSFYKWIIKRILSSKRCLEIRCMSQACKQTLLHYLGDEIKHKVVIHYPVLKANYSLPKQDSKDIRFLFVGSQFDIKGGECLLYAFQKLQKEYPHVYLDMITHLPEEYKDLSDSIPNLMVHPSHFSREEILELFMKKSDILVHPTFIESFGMVALEAISCGLAVIASDIYAMKEMVSHHQNGALIQPPISIWDGVKPSIYFTKLSTIKDTIIQLDKLTFTEKLYQEMLFYSDIKKLRLAQQTSTKLFEERFL